MSPKTPLSLLIAALLIPALGCEGPQAPSRTPVNDFGQLRRGLVFSWPEDRQPVRFWTENDGAPRRLLELGIRIWEAQFLYGEFRGEVVADSSQADVLVEFVGPPLQDEPLTDDTPAIQACSGVTAVPPIVSNQLTAPFSIRVNWGVAFDNQDTINCVARVTNHEIGHALGIFEESGNTDDLMFTTPLVRLPSRIDRNTVLTLYHTTANITPFER